MPTDPQIPLMALHSLSQQQPPDVMRSMQDMAQLSDYAELSRERREKADAAQRQEEDNQAVSAAAQQFTDPQGTTDWDRVLHKLYTDGRVGPAQAIETKLAAQKRQAVLDKNTELEGEQKKWGLAKTFVNSIDDSDPEAFQTTWTLVQKNVGRLLGQEYADAMGPTASKEKLEQIKKFGEDATQTFTRQKAATDAAEAALKLDDDKDKNDRERRDYWTKHAATMLHAARNDQEYQSIRDQIAQLIKGRKPEQDGMPSTLAGEVLGQFDKVWTKDTPDRLDDLEMTANERQSKKLTRREQDITHGDRVNEQQIQTDREKRIAGASKSGLPESVYNMLADIADQDPKPSRAEAQKIFMDAYPGLQKTYPALDVAKATKQLDGLYGQKMPTAEEEATMKMYADVMGPKPGANAAADMAAHKPAPKVLPESEIQRSMKENKWTREQAVAAAKARGYTIGK
jgi:hypothetical protein